MMCETIITAGTNSPAIWREDHFAPIMVVLPAGEFLMGASAGDKFANDTERPAHRVRFETPFALGKFPVTVREFRCFQSDHSPDDDASLPVVRVNWQDACDYCEWLTVQTRRRYRLPSEAEWEFACRAGSSTPFAMGNDLSVADANFLYDENGVAVGSGARSVVSSYAPNRFGLHDLHGNVCEWIEDIWHPNYHGAPADGSARRTGGHAGRVIRGGAWDYLPRLLRSSWRDWCPPGQRADHLGFRVATSDLAFGG